MKALVFEPFSGASGDMILSSLLDMGMYVDESKIADAVSVFNLEMEVKEVEKRGIAAKKVTFVNKNSKSKKSADGAMTVQSYADIVRTIERSGLSEEIIQNSLSIFERIADAESSVHRVQKETLTFHELGALDTIGDLVGCSIAFMDIQPATIISTPIAVGGGSVKAEHGLLPIPAPATVEILKNTSLLYHGGPFESELLTPTGAALLAHFVHRSEHFLPQMRIEETGYGAGLQDLPMPNVLRVSLGEITNENLHLSMEIDAIEVLETNVDNVTGEMMGNFVEVLMAEGAKDVAISPVLMKKGRTGYVIKVITSQQDTARIAYRIMEETGSLGVRVMQVKHRFVADREEKTVKVRIRGVDKEVGVKIGRDAKGNVLNVAAEFEDVKRVAHELKMPLKDIMKIVEGSYIGNYSGSKFRDSQFTVHG
ncbi:MAG: nickel pincer cofactor biosynthesis protein LarC [Methanophagales archaeon]|nr:nickel pincer cofactor biosynthesis protein LarC [Methanophagales archaeon]